MKNKGSQQHRLKNNPLEQRFAKEWEKINTGSRSTLDYILHTGNQRFPITCSDRDREVAATVIQWLGSPVGQTFLETVLSKPSTLSTLSYYDKLEILLSDILGEPYVSAAGVPKSLDAAAIKMFIQPTVLKRHEEIVRACLELLDSGGYLTEENLEKIFESTVWGMKAIFEGAR